MSAACHSRSKTRTQSAELIQTNSHSVVIFICIKNSMFFFFGAFPFQGHHSGSFGSFFHNEQFISHTEIQWLRPGGPVLALLTAQTSCDIVSSKLTKCQFKTALFVAKMSCHDDVRETGFQEGGIYLFVHWSCYADDPITQPINLQKSS